MSANPRWVYTHRSPFECDPASGGCKPTEDTNIARQTRSPHSPSGAFASNPKQSLFVFRHVLSYDVSVIRLKAKESLTEKWVAEKWAVRGRVWSCPKFSCRCFSRLPFFVTHVFVTRDFCIP